MSRRCRQCRQCRAFQPHDFYSISAVEIQMNDRPNSRKWRDIGADVAADVADVAVYDGRHRRRCREIEWGRCRRCRADVADVAARPLAPGPPQKVPVPEMPMSPMWGRCREPIFKIFSPQKVDASKSATSAPMSGRCRRCRADDADVAGYADVADVARCKLRHRRHRHTICGPA